MDCWCIAVKSYFCFIRSFLGIMEIGIVSKVAEPCVNRYRMWPLLNQSACNLHADWLQAYSDEQAAVEPEAAARTKIYHNAKIFGRYEKM